MISIRSLRLLRPAVRTPLVAVKPSQSFHVGRPSGVSSRLQDGVGRTSQDGIEVAEIEKKQKITSGTPNEEARTSEFKKNRIKALDVARQKGLHKETYPRLVHRAKRMSVLAWKRNFKNGKPDDFSKAELVTLYGRVDSVRMHGNRLIFLTIVNEFERVQGMVKYDNLHGTPGISPDSLRLLAKMIEKGDHISITGKPTRTSSGQLTINAAVLPELLSPTMEQIPRTLTDPETRAQKRHLDMIVNPEVADILRLRSHITKYMRDYFHGRDFLEFQTPILAENAGGAVARSFTTSATEFGPSKELSLRIAPELWLKRLVVGGVHKVFEIGPAFRNEGIDATHNPEFTICEFYSAYTTLPELISRTEELICGLAQHCQDLISTQLTSLPPIDLAKFARPFRQIEFVPGLEEALGFRLPKLTGRDAYPELIAILRLGGIDVPGGIPPTLPKLLDRLAAIYLEPKSFEEPIFVTHHPACMSPLAKSFLCPNTLQLVSARTEFFVHGRELANMYEEENDPAVQARKLAEHRALGTGKSVEEVEAEAEAEAEADIQGEKGRSWKMERERDAPLDKSYIKALEAGLPPTGGWGCGVERLVMMFSGASRIGDCLSFGTLRNVVGLTSGEVPQNRSEDS